MIKDKIKATLETFYRDVFNGGKADLLDELMAGPYIQHNPHMPDGIMPLAAYLKHSGGVEVEVKRIAVENDLAFVHVRFPNWMGAEHAAVDIFRFSEDGKILEHWDVLQAVPDAAANSNTMF